MLIRNFHSDDLHIENFRIAAGEAWCIFGSNHSGISEFVQLLSGSFSSAEGVEIPGKPAVISFAHQQEIFEEELKKDDSDFLDRIDPGTPAASFLHQPERHGPPRDSTRKTEPGFWIFFN